MRHVNVHRKFFKRVTLLLISGFAVTAIAATDGLGPTAQALLSQQDGVGQVSFTFDDGYLSTLTQAAPALNAYGMSGTVYTTTGFVGQPEYMSWEQNRQLRDTYGWEIGSHSVSHPLSTEVTPAQMEAEARDSKAAFNANGFTPTAYATPFGDYNGAVEANIAKYYTSHRGFHDLGYNTWPYAPYLLKVQQVQGGVSVAQVKAYIDQAKANNEWLILVFHDIKTNPSTDPEEYEYSPADLSAIAAYTQQVNIRVSNITEGMPVGSNNLIENGGFENGVNSGWTNNSPANVSTDTSGQGSMPNPTTSAKVVAAADKNVSVFSSQAAVKSTERYAVFAYINIVIIGNGEVALYIDEYDINGNWISGKYAMNITSDQIKDIVYMYQPTSINVARSSLQFIATAGSGITAYIDNVQFYKISADDTTPTTPTEPTTPTAPTNLFENGDFSNGIGNGWTTDTPSSITADSTSHGSTSTPQHSIKLDSTSTTRNAHLFSPIIAVNSSTGYQVSAFLNMVSLTTGEVAFYIDEYDASGNWISGKYMAARRTVGSDVIRFSYTPSSSLVVSARLQTILSGTGIVAYLDDVLWNDGTSSTTPATPTTPTTPTTPATPTTPTQAPIISEEFANGLGAFTTDSPASVTSDSSGNGGATENTHSAKMVAGTDKNVHLFSPITAIDPSKALAISAHVNIISIANGELALYVDEYDAAGNWISGRYYLVASADGTKDFVLSHMASSTNVASVRLQFIVTAGSGATVYVDGVTAKQ